MDKEVALEIGLKSSVAGWKNISNCGKFEVILYSSLACFFAEVISKLLLSLGGKMSLWLSRSLIIGTGLAVGVLLYTRYFVAPHEFDWWRALFVGLFSGTAIALWSRKRG